MPPFALVAAGNTEVPAALVLRDKGFTLRRETTPPPTRERWIAEKHDLSFAAGSPLEVLGLVAIFEARGAQWQAPGDEIETFLATYYPGTQSP